jgi:hypothetical protein
MSGIAERTKRMKLILFYFQKIDFCICSSVAFICFLFQQTGTTLVKSSSPETYLLEHCARFRSEGITYGVEKDDRDGNSRCYAFCVFCVDLKKQYPSQRNFEHIFPAHIAGKKHIKEKTQKRIPQFFLSTMLFLKPTILRIPLLLVCATVTDQMI